MTIRNKNQLIELLKQASEEMDCDGPSSDCRWCRWYVESREKYMENCPMLIARDMVKVFFTNKE